MKKQKEIGTMKFGDAHAIYIGLTALDTQLEKVVPETRLKIGIILNRMRPAAELLERTQSRAIADLTAAAAAAAGDAESVAARQARETKLQADLADAIAKLRAGDCDVAHVPTLLKADLRLDDNPKVTSATLAQVLPIIEGIT